MSALELISREVVINRVSEVRFGAGADPISRITFWRWCHRIGCNPCQSTFTTDETSRFIRLAEEYRHRDIQLQTYGVRYQQNGKTV